MIALRHRHLAAMVKPPAFRWIALVVAGVMAQTSIGPLAKGESTMWAYVGTYTQGDSQGIYAFRFDPRSGDMGDPILAAKMTNPSFVAIHPSGKFLYAVGEVGEYEGEKSGFVRAFRIDHDSGALAPINTRPSGGGAPCHLVVDATGKSVLVANYSGGSVCSIAIEGDGRLGEAMSLQQHVGSNADSRRQQNPHAHSINLDRANRLAFVADLGLDKVIVYRFDADESRLSLDHAPTSARVSPGSGPRHFAFHPNENYAYVINELSSTIDAFGYDPRTGVLTNLQTISTLPEDNKQESYTAEIVVHPTGQFVYGSNRGHDSIAVFQVDADTGKLERVQIEPTQGSTPRNFAVDPTGRYLLAENQGSDTIVAFRIDPQTGRLNSTGKVLSVPSPVCIRFLTEVQ